MIFNEFQNPVLYEAQNFFFFFHIQFDLFLSWKNKINCKDQVLEQPHYSSNFSLLSITAQISNIYYSIYNIVCGNETCLLYFLNFVFVLIKSILIYISVLSTETFWRYFLLSYVSHWCFPCLKIMCSYLATKAIFLTPCRG